MLCSSKKLIFVMFCNNVGLVLQEFQVLECILAQVSSLTRQGFMQLILPHLKMDIKTQYFDIVT